MVIALLLSLFANIGCQSLQGPENTKSRSQGVTIVHSTGTEQFSYVKQNESLSRFCTETDTDVQGTASSGLSISAAGDSIGDTSSTGATTLGGRDPTVLITRELMFRACELMLNTNAEAPEAVKIYAGTLAALLKITQLHKRPEASGATQPKGTTSGPTKNTAANKDASEK
jgi:hypothetical protein